MIIIWKACKPIFIGKTFFFWIYLKALFWYKKMVFHLTFDHCNKLFHLCYVNIVRTKDKLIFNLPSGVSLIADRCYAVNQNYMHYYVQLNTFFFLINLSSSFDLVFKKINKKKNNFWHLKFLIFTHILSFTWLVNFRPVIFPAVLPVPIAAVLDPVTVQSLAVLVKSSRQLNCLFRQLSTELMMQ